ncbi:hypothetical protein [Dysgonomonas sp. Marseille-P4361]|uniref:hypothetical protein n=1 Tax=Dysgonomonas sp. Marseille-P4361 TaxID=2161820 RepID=UPI000D555AB5|nr:hypothetical protein [Dysgonomonas sp. Marseille-P4361]
MKKLYILFFLISFSLFYACQDYDQYKPIRPPDEDKEKPDPLANVSFRFDETKTYLLKGAYSKDTLYNFNDTVVRKGSRLDGDILFRIDGNFIYSGSEVKGKPLYYIESNNICNFITYYKVYRIDDNYFFPAWGPVSPPISHYAGEVVFNIDGDYLRQGRKSDGKIMFTRNGNTFHQGEGTRGSIAFHIDGDVIRLGSSPNGAILFTVRTPYLYKGRSEETVSFNMSDGYIRKGRSSFSIGEK